MHAANLKRKKEEKRKKGRERRRERERGKRRKEEKVHPALCCQTFTQTSGAFFLVFMTTLFMNKTILLTMNQKNAFKIGCGNSSTVSPGDSSRVSTQCFTVEPALTLPFYATDKFCHTLHAQNPTTENESKNCFLDGLWQQQQCFPRRLQPGLHSVLHCRTCSPTLLVPFHVNSKICHRFHVQDVSVDNEQKIFLSKICSLIVSSVSPGSAS